MRRVLLVAGISAIATAIAIVACSTPSPGPDPGVGTAPQLPPPTKQVIPTISVADAVGWPSNAVPTAPQGLAVKAFAAGLDHPRWVYVLPNGDVLVAETNAPPKPDDGKGFKGAMMKLFMKKAGAVTPSANRITLLRDTNGDGVADTRTAFMSGLNSPFGMALVGDTLYIANTDAVVKVPYRPGDTSIAQPPVKVADLPAGTINHHWTKNLIANRDGSKLYVTVGSNSNIGENGMAVEENRAAILEIDAASGATRLFASGLRNPNGLAWHPESGALWTVVNERDELGNNLVPDYLTSVREGAFYGWPYSYYGANVDTRVAPQQPDLVSRAIPPDYALGSHVAPLGLAFYDAQLLPQRYRGGAFVGEHGSWNRTPKSGYKVVFVAFSNGRPTGQPEDVMTGFLDEKGNARGRPVGVAVDKAGALLVADDVGNVIWRLAPGS
jgi:glucose/arabinose dehydrogenase